jgi:hypothetical protein
VIALCEAPIQQTAANALSGIVVLNARSARIHRFRATALMPALAATGDFADDVRHTRNIRYRIHDDAAGLTKIRPRSMRGRE